MPWVVFLRAVNGGGTNRCQPALIAKQLARFDIVNIGAVGTFVVRENVSESALRVDAQYVDEHLGNLAKDEDLSRYIL